MPTMKQLVRACFLVTFVVLTSIGNAQPERYPERAWARFTKLQPQATNEAATPGPALPSRPLAESVLSPQNAPDVRVRPTTNTTQSEMSIFVSPLNNNIVLASANASDFPVSVIYGTGVYWSTDAGLTWSGFDQPPAGNANRGDPASVIDRNGHFYVGSIAPNDGQGVMRSTNGGTTWNYFQVSNPNGSLLDKNHLWVDNSTASAHQGNLYSAWTDFGQPDPNPIEFARSTDMGATWVNTQNISGTIMTSSEFGQGANLQTGPNGEVYVAWSINQGTSPFTERSIGFNRSTDGGVTWGPGSRALSNILGIRTSSFAPYGIRSNSFPTMGVSMATGNIYIAWTNIGVPGVNTGDPDIYLIKSTNQGTSWGTPVRVNNDAVGNGARQWFPWLTVDPETDQISIVFYDGRNYIGTNRADVVVAHSIDGGATFDNFVVSDSSFTVGPLPGFGGNYNGDYIGIAARGAKGYPIWSSQVPGTNSQGWVSPILFADPTDPNPPSAVSAYSDFTTPTSIDLSWVNPTTLVDGSPITPFVIRIQRDGVQIAEVADTETTYVDTGRTIYTEYSYTLETRLLANDSMSTAAQTQWTAGGSPFPASPTGVGIVTTTTDATISWANPTTQKDGTPIHDFAGTQIWRNGALIDSVNETTTQYVDVPPPGFVYTYVLRAFNSLDPRRYSDPSAGVGGYVGDVPDVLVWQPAAAVTNSGNEMVASLTRLGVSNFKSESLFVFGPDLSQFNAIFAVVGIYSNNHVIRASDPEGAALDAYAIGGGNFYLEGGDVFNYDPESSSGYQVRPIFGLNDGPDGGADVSSATGRTLFNGLSFTYTGGNNFMDELKPAFDGAARTLWIIPGSSPPNDTMGVFNFYGAGRSIASVVEFGGLTDAGSNLKDSVMARMIQFFNQPLSPPAFAVSPTVLGDTLLANQTSSKSLVVSNTTLPPAEQLYVNLSENAGWLNVSPTADTINGGGSKNFSVNFDAAGLGTGTYTTDIVITSNDPGMPTVNVPVTLLVAESPSIVVSPDSVEVVVAPNGMAVDTLTISNVGQGPLTWSITDLPGGTVSRPYIPQIQADALYPPRVGRDGWPIPIGKNDADIHHGTPVTEGQGGPDSAGYRWIDSDEPGGPTFSWFDISGIGTPIAAGEWLGSGGTPNADDGRVVKPLPFPFTFYGVSYNEIKIVTNGWMSFATSSTNTAFTNAAIPSTAEPNNALYPWWDDLDLRTQGTVHYHHDAPNNRFIIQFTNAPHFGTAQPGTYTFQVILYADGRILYQYLDMQQTLNSATIGIENPTGTVALQVVFNAAYMHNNLAILIAKDLPWLSQDPISGIVAPGDSAKVVLTFNSSGYSVGAYTGRLEITSNDFANSPKNIPVRMIVQGGGASIIVTSPNGGEQWVVGQTYPITWVKNLVDTVKIEYSTNGGSSWVVITEGTAARVSVDNPKLANSGTYNWLVPNTVSANCLVRISDKANPSTFDVSNGPFAIVSSTPPVTEAWADHVTSAFRATVTNEGNIGSLNAFVGTGPGSGFMFNPVSSAGQRLFEGSLMIGLDSVRVSDAARNNQNPEVFDADFKFASHLDSSQSGGIRRVIVTAYNDSLAESPFGVRVAQRTVSYDTAGLNNFLIVELDLTNTWSTPYAGLMVGAYFDWDVNPANAQDRGAVIVDSTNTIPGVNNGNPFPMELMELHQGASPNSWMGIVPLNDNLFFARRIAIQSSEIYPPRMTNADKWLYMTQNRAGNPNGDAGSAVDHAQIFGLGPYDIGPGATRRVGFAILGGASLANCVSAARAAQRAWVERLGNQLNVITSDVTENPFETLPDRYDLEQNFPNPFNPNTHIRFALPEQAFVSLKVFDVLGREMATLVDGAYSAGVLTAEWSGHNENGVAMSSGVYFYRLEARGVSGQTTVFNRKMVLMK